MTVVMVPSIDLDPWPSLGNQVADWIEAYLVYGPGDLRGQPVKLDLEKRAILVRLYEVWPRGSQLEGRRRFNRGCVSVRKGWAKSETSAMIAAAELHPDSPVRVIGWDGHGNPQGGPVRDPYIPMVAYTEEQSDELAYSALRVILQESRVSKDFDVGLTRIIRKTGDGRAVSLAASPDARDGARTTFQVCDEVHRWNLPRLRQAHRTMLANLPKRKLADPWSLEITTAYAPGENSVAEMTMEYARAIIEGKITNPKLFFFHRQADEKPVDQGGYDLSNVDDIRKAVIEASGPVVAEWSDIDSIVEQFQDPGADRPYLCRVWLNWIVQAADRAFNAEAWGGLAVHGDIEDGSMITLGFDGSHSRDSTALIATDVESGYQWTFGIWERPFNRQENWEVPEQEVDERVAEAFERFDVLRMYCDPYPWESHISSWQGKYGSDRVLYFDTRTLKRMSYALRIFETAIKTGEITHSDDPAIKAHIGNSCKQLLNIRDDEGERMWKIQKERPDSPHKIDAAIASVLSWQARIDAIAAGALQTDGPSVYENRGILVF